MYMFCMYVHLFQDKVFSSGLGLWKIPQSAKLLIRMPPIIIKQTSLTLCLIEYFQSQYGCKWVLYNDNGKRGGEQSGI